MPVLKKTFTLDDGTELVVRQAGGMAKLKIENIQARVFRDHLHFGLDPTEWSDEQQNEFSRAIDAERLRRQTIPVPMPGNPRSSTLTT